MGYSVGPAAVFLIQTTSLIVYIAFAFIPSQLGANEGASYFLFPYLGLTAGVGVAMEMLRRLRVVAVVALGLVLLGFFSLRKEAPKPTAALADPQPPSS
jgi:carbon starvation protein CstA